MGILDDLEVIEETPVNEELNILLDEMECLDLDTWSYGFIMDMADKNWLTPRQSAKITDIYKKYIDGDI